MKITCMFDVDKEEMHFLQEFVSMVRELLAVTKTNEDNINKLKDLIKKSEFKWN